jgi:hypothetical protein
MRAMKPSTAGQPFASEVVRESASEPDSTEKAYGNLHFKPLVTPGLFKGPILPEWLSKPFRRKETPGAP